MIHETNESELEAGTGSEFVVPPAPRVIEECDAGDSFEAVF
jgi:hypothetical protein